MPASKTVLNGSRCLRCESGRECGLVVGLLLSSAMFSSLAGLIRQRWPFKAVFQASFQGLLLLAEGHLGKLENGFQCF